MCARFGDEGKIMPNQKRSEAAKKREEREATALRENLKKRKSQQQARKALHAQTIEKREG